MGFISDIFYGTNKRDVSISRYVGCIGQLKDYLCYPESSEVNAMGLRELLMISANPLIAEYNNDPVARSALLGGVRDMANFGHEQSLMAAMETTVRSINHRLNFSRYFRNEAIGVLFETVIPPYIEHCKGGYDDVVRALLKVSDTPDKLGQEALYKAIDIITQMAETDLPQAKALALKYFPNDKIIGNQPVPGI